MTLLDLFYISVATLYGLTALWILVGLFLKWLRTVDDPLTSASVIICARDEEADLPICLQSLERQVLDPGISLEIVLVNDASVDGTLDRMEEYARSSRFQVRILSLPPLQPDEPGGKWRPLKAGLRLASGEALLLTDADAVLPPRWVASHMRELEAAELSAGFAQFEEPKPWSQVQNLDLLFMEGVGSAVSRWGLPIGALGKNMAVRRADYLAAGGLEAAGFSLTEDLSILQMIVFNGGRMSFRLDRDLLVSSSSMPTWKTFHNQRKRWASGFWYLKPEGKFFVMLMAVRNFAVPLGVLALLPEAFWVWGITALLNFLIQWRVTGGLGIRKRLLFFPLWELFYTWITPIMAISFIVKPKVAWKGRKFTRPHEPAVTA